MKSKLMLCCALLISAVVASAIPWSADASRHSRSLIRDGKPVEARAYLDTIEGVPGTVAIFRAWADHVDTSVDTSTTAKLKAVVEGYNSAQGFTGAQLKNTTDYAMLWIYVTSEDYEAALAYYSTLENPSSGCVGRAVIALQQQGKADEAIALAVANKQWYLAFNAANAKKDKVKVFEYGKKLLLDAFQKPKIVKLVLDAIAGFNYAETDAVTIDDQILFLYDFDAKYSRLMVPERNLPDAEKVWEPLIADARVTAERLLDKKQKRKALLGE